MSNVPTKNPITIDIPAGKDVVWVVSTQSAAPQTVVVTDSNGVKKVNVSDTGTGGQPPKLAGSGVFQATGNGTLTVTMSANGKPSNVIWDQLSLGTGTTTLSGTFAFVSEDYTDDDYNDSSLTMTWFDKRG